MQLNYHHLRYFYEVATEGRLGRAAERLNLSQSALSMQIKQLEARLGEKLFEKSGRTLALTEAGRVALDHAHRIFGAGEEMLVALKRNETTGAPLRIGALSTLSRNFQLRFLAPILADAKVGVVLRSGDVASLLNDLETLALDVVLTTETPPAEATGRFAAQRIDEQPVALHGAPRRVAYDSLDALIANEPLILPTESVIRAGFEALVARLGAAPRIAAEVDDMAMVRLLAREGVGVAIAPSVVFADEIAGGAIARAPFDLGIMEPFYAVTIPRRFAHPALGDLLRAQTPDA